MTASDPTANHLLKSTLFTDVLSVVNCERMTVQSPYDCTKSFSHMEEEVANNNKTEDATR